MIRILVIDDHRIFREGLKKILGEAHGVEVVAEAEDGDAAVAMIVRLTWDVALLDVSLPGRSALEILTLAQRHHPDRPVLILTMHDDELLALRFMRAGARGYLTKDCDPEILLQAIRKTIAGGKHLSPDLAARIVDVMDTEGSPPPHTRLSDREFTVLCRIASGSTVTQIAEALAISPRTASTYRARILDKLNLKNNAELTHYAFRHHLVK